MHSVKPRLAKRQQLLWSLPGAVELATKQFDVRCIQGVD
jgi:hypothetical protein